MPIEGAACLDIDKLVWKEKQLTDPSLVNLIGARGVRFQGKNYIHGPILSVILCDMGRCLLWASGGKYMDNNEKYSSDIIEIGSGLLPPHCDIRRIRSHGLEGTPSLKSSKSIYDDRCVGMADHVLFMSGDWIYACLGRVSQIGEETRVYRANLTNLEEIPSLSLPMPTPVFDLTVENEETAMVALSRRAFSS